LKFDSAINVDISSKSISALRTHTAILHVRLGSRISRKRNNQKNFIIRFIS